MNAFSPLDARKPTRWRNFALALLACLGLAISSATVASAAGQWWVIVGSAKNPDYADTAPANAKVNAELAACGVQAFSDFSSKWSGFTPGLTVSVLGPYQSKSTAETMRNRILSCIPSAYLKQGTYAGE